MLKYFRIFLNFSVSDGWRQSVLSMSLYTFIQLLSQVQTAAVGPLFKKG